MPGLVVERGRRSPSTSSEESSSRDGSEVIDQVEYPALSFPGYSEKPLSEQLEPIAVVGMGCRLPGDISSPAGFWDMMMNKGTGRTPKVPKSRFNIDAYYHANNDRPGSFSALGGYFLNSDLQEFDPGLFGLSPIEAMWMDPQQRKLLEVVYEAFESGGAPLEKIAGTKIACFVGSFTSDFQQMAFKEPDFRHSYAATGVDPGIISNRITHVFNLNGPSIVVNTACSSSVYAMHNACNALRNYECVGAVVGGTNLVLTVDQHMNTGKLGVLSPTSTCHTFDERANGYGRADGVGAVYLKRLSDAVRDGDPIRGILRSSAVNSNGKAPSVGISNPNKEGQEAVIRHAYERGGDLDPRLTGYFECHGTGTDIGDPIEVHAVAKAMNDARRPGEDALWIGAVKTNIGHSEAASGLSAVIKAVLTVEKGVIPPTRGVVNLNQKIDWHGWKVKVATEPVPFSSLGLPVRRVSVNSFGYGGTNAHIIVEGVDSFVPGHQIGKAKPAPRGAFNRKRPLLLPFSAHDKPTLRKNIAAYAGIVSKYDLLDLSYTLGNRRSQLQRRGYVVGSHASLKDAFDNDGGNFTFAEKKKTPTIGFVFTGQGAQWAKMGADLMAYYPSFLRSIRLLDRTLGELPDAPEWTLEDSLLEDAQTSRVNEAEFSQPLCTAVQIAIVQLLNAWGIRPTVTAGHSSGEIAAAYAAGLISAPAAMVAAYYRGKVLPEIKSDGAMMAVGLGADAVQPYLADVNGKVVIACHNSPQSVTLSGDSDGIAAVKAKLDAENIFARQVKTGGKAYHSYHMKAVASLYESLIQRVKASLPSDPAAPRDVTMVSSVTNAKIPHGTVVDEYYWSANLTSPVLFNQAIQTIARDEQLSAVDLLIEIGPHSALSGPIRQICVEHKFGHINYIPSLIRNADSASQLLKVAGEMFLRGAPLDMDRVTSIEESLPQGKMAFRKGQILVDLPTYQWNYAKNLWSENRMSIEHRAPQHPRHDVLGRLIPGASRAEPIWRNILRIKDIPWLRDHSLGGEAVYPTAAYFAMALEAITQMNETSPNPVKIESYVLRDVTIKAALVTPDTDNGIEVVFNMRPSVYTDSDNQDSSNAWWDFNVSSVSEDGHLSEHMTGTIGLNARKRGGPTQKVPNLPQRASGKSWNQALKEVGFDYGPTFQDMDDIRFDGKKYAASAKTNIKQECGVVDGESRYVLHPGTVDSCLQLIIVSIYAGRSNDMPCGIVPIQVDEVAIWPPTESQVKEHTASAYSWTHQRGIRSFISNSQLVAHDGEMIMDISDMRVVAYEAAVPQKADLAIKPQPYGEMVWKHDVDSVENKGHLSHLDVMELVELAFHKNPSVKIVEVGSEHAKDILSKFSNINYTVTEASDEPSDHLRKMIDAFPNAKYQKLDTVQALEMQAIEKGVFDLAIAPNGLSYLVSAQNVRHLLSAGGHAIFKATEKSNTSTLEAAGFSTPDSPLSDSGSSRFIYTTALDIALVSQPPVDTSKVTLIYRNQPHALVSEIEKGFKMAGWSTGLYSLRQCAPGMRGHVILLADLEGPLLATLKEDELSAIQNLTSQASSILWVTRGGLLTGKIPEYAMTAGLARSVTSENASLDFTTLDFDLENTSGAEVATTVFECAKRQHSKPKIHESEYYVSDGSVYISRLVANEELNKAYVVDKSELVSKDFNPEDRLVGKVQSGKVIFESTEISNQKLGPNEVEVQVMYSGMNKEDAVVISGSDYPTTFSQEIAGRITRLGSSVQGFTVGDNVFGFSFDKFSTYQRTSASLLQRVEKSEPLQDLVTLPSAYATAIYGMKELARVQPNETVLILEGTGANGIAAVNFVQLMDAKPLVAVQTQEELFYVRGQLGLSTNQVILLSPTSTASQIQTLATERGIDVVFSSGSVDPSLARECWRHISPFGRFVDCGRKNSLKRSVLDRLPLSHGASYFSFDILEMAKWKPALLSNALRLTLSLYQQHSIKRLSPVEVKNISQLDEAVASFSDKFSSGKTVIAYRPSSTPIKLSPTRPVLKFRADATYLLVGCLGGLGRSLTSWMMENGARRFAFLSRSGTDQEQAAILVQDIEAAGVNVQVIRGDATVESDVVRAVRSVPSEYPIRGVVQAAMVLRDGLFHSMPYANWVTSTRPKVQGTQNLHKVLKDMPLDFFIMTSSTSGTIGTPGQSNYAAANGYLDSLARHRKFNGQAAGSLVIPMVLGVGYVAEHPEIEEALKRKGIYGIDEEHLLQSFEASMTAQAGLSKADHIVVGMDPVMLQKAVSETATTDGFWLEDARLSTTVHQMSSASGGTSAESGHSVLANIKSAASPDEAVTLATNHFIEKLERLLLLDRDVFEPDVKSVADYGIDSMIGAELRNWIFKEFALDIPFQQLLGPTLTITKFSKVVCKNQGLDVGEI